jgi:hypothetical protein
MRYVATTTGWDRACRMGTGTRGPVQKVNMQYETTGGFNV